MKFTHINELKTVLTNELKLEQLNEKALNETWNALKSPLYLGDVQNEHLVNYYISCLRFEQLKDNI
jgi:FlaA1/EpsC-like NDP-sugar epimerase